MLSKGGCLVALGLAAAACGGGDDGASKQDYVDALSGVEPGDPFTEEEARCVTGEMVDIVGLDTLNENDVLDKAEDDPDGSLRDFGVVLTEEQRAELGPAMGECLDVRAAMVAELSSDPSVGPELAECLGNEIPQEIWEALLVTGLADGDQAGEGQEELMAQMQAAGEACAGG
ncbi:MAG TPA: hypothetical protein VIL36_08540 [Acidimicrobiales bacterium]